MCCPFTLVPNAHLQDSTASPSSRRMGRPSPYTSKSRSLRWSTFFFFSSKKKGLASKPLAARSPVLRRLLEDANIAEKVKHMLGDNVTTALTWLYGGDISSTENTSEVSFFSSMFGVLVTSMQVNCAFVSSEPLMPLREWMLSLVNNPIYSGVLGHKPCILHLHFDVLPSLLKNDHFCVSFF